MEKNQIISFISNERRKEQRPLNIVEVEEFLSLMEKELPKFLKRKWKKFDEVRNGVILTDTEDTELSEHNITNLPKDIMGGYF